MSTIPKIGPGNFGAPGGVRVAMVVYGDITHDSRVQKEASALAEAGHVVTLFCLAGRPEAMPGLDRRVSVVARRPSVTRILPRSPSPFFAATPGHLVSRAVQRASWVWQYIRNLRAWGASIAEEVGRPDVLHLHDFAALVAMDRHLAPRPLLVYDVHDLFLDTGSGARLPWPARWAVRQYEGHLVRRAAAVVTVNAGLAQELRRHYRPRAVVVVHNCPPRWTPPPVRPTRLRDAAGIPDGAPIVLFHGALGPDRGLDTLCDAMLEPSLRDAHVVLMGYGVLREHFVNLAGDARFGGRLHVLDPTVPTDLLWWVASADVGVLARPATNLDLVLSTPNKLFECLAAGTPAVVSDFPAVRRIVIEDELGPLGVTCRPDDAADLARAVQSIIRLPHPQMEDLRRRCATAARLRWNWENEVIPLLRLYAALAARHRAAGGSVGPSGASRSPGDESSRTGSTGVTRTAADAARD